MSLTGFLDNVFFLPLLAIYHHIFGEIFGAVSSLGCAIVLFGLLVNLVLAPVYYQMDRTGRARKAERKAMEEEIARIKAHYKGRERYYYIQTIHRQFRYHPIYQVLESGDLYVQIFVFVTVYRYLSSLEILHETRFLFIADLGRPDALLWGVNVLPIAMTALNVASAVLYSKSAGVRRRAFVVAALFLVLLYRSPSGLVLYWTCNNAFSLLRNYVARNLVLSDDLGRWLSRVAQQE